VKGGIVADRKLRQEGESKKEKMRGLLAGKCGSKKIGSAEGGAENGLTVLG